MGQWHCGIWNHIVAMILMPQGNVATFLKSTVLRLATSYFLQHLYRAGLLKTFPKCPVEGKLSIEAAMDFLRWQEGSSSPVSAFLQPTVLFFSHIVSLSPVSFLLGFHKSMLFLSNLSHRFCCCILFPLALIVALPGFGPWTNFFIFLPGFTWNSINLHLHADNPRIHISSPDLSPKFLPLISVCHRWRVLPGFPTTTHPELASQAPAYEEGCVCTRACVHEDI